MNDSHGFRRRAAGHMRTARELAEASLGEWSLRLRDELGDSSVDAYRVGRWELGREEVPASAYVAAASLVGLAPEELVDSDPASPALVVRLDAALREVRRLLDDPVALLARVAMLTREQTAPA